MILVEKIRVYLMAKLRRAGDFCTSIATFFKTIWIRWIVSRAEIDLSAKCPSCGHRSPHKILFKEEYQRNIHHCEICSAEWGEPCIVKWESWKVSRELEEQPGENVAAIAGGNRE